jgi:hypothetical protein
MIGAEWGLTLAALACILGSAAAAGAGRVALALSLAGMTAVLAGLLALLYALQGDWPQAVLSAGVAAMWARLWWSGRKRKKRSLRALGNKARARLAALARNMPRPGPVLRPAPQGARA